jgi:hypothetical protein
MQSGGPVCITPDLRAWSHFSGGRLLHLHRRILKNFRAKVDIFAPLY